MTIPQTIACLAAFIASYLCMGTPPVAAQPQPMESPSFLPTPEAFLPTPEPSLVPVAEPSPTSTFFEFLSASDTRDASLNDAFCIEDRSEGIDIWFEDETYEVSALPGGAAATLPARDHVFAVENRANQPIEIEVQLLSGGKTVRKATFKVDPSPIATPTILTAHIPKGVTYDALEVWTVKSGYWRQVGSHDVTTFLRNKDGYKEYLTKNYTTFTFSAKFDI